MIDEQIFTGEIQPFYTIHVAGPNEKAIHAVLDSMSLAEMAALDESVVWYDEGMVNVEKADIEITQPQVRVLRTLEVQLVGTDFHPLGVAYEVVSTGKRYWNTSYGIAAMQAYKNKTATPIFEHDCEYCNYLGQHLDREKGHEYDLYYCVTGNMGIPTIVARHGNGYEEYTSGRGSASAVLLEGARRAVEYGFTFERE